MYARGFSFAATTGRLFFTPNQSIVFTVIFFRVFGFFFWTHRGMYVHSVLTTTPGKEKMGSGVSLAKRQAEVRSKVLERFIYVDLDSDGLLSLAEIESYHSAFDASYDAAAIRAEFRRLDRNGDGKVSVKEYLAAHGMDVAKLKEEQLQRERCEELDREEKIQRAGAAAVEILPGGSEAESLVKADVRQVEVLPGGSEAASLVAADVRQVEVALIDTIDAVAAALDDDDASSLAAANPRTATAVSAVSLRESACLSMCL